MSNRIVYSHSRSYRFTETLALSLKDTAFSLGVTETNLVRLILENGIQLMSDKQDV